MVTNPGEEAAHEQDLFFPSSSRREVAPMDLESSTSRRSRSTGLLRSLSGPLKATGFLILGFCIGFSVFTFRTSPRPSPLPSSRATQKYEHPVRFLVVGDWGRLGLYNQSQVAVQMGRVGEQLGIQFVISTGDNFYDYGLKGTNDPSFTTSFTNVFTAPSLQTTWYAVLGNHDYMGDAISQLSRQLVKKDPRWFCEREFELHHSLCSTGTCDSSVDMFFIDTTPFINEYWDSPHHRFNWTGLSSRMVQLNSQVESLSNKLANSKATWKIVIGHHTIRSVGYHGDTLELLDRLLPVLEKYKADIYINGHDHNLQHIKRRDSSIHFITSGGGSKAFKGLRSFDDSTGMHFAYDGQGFLAVLMKESYVSFSFYDVFGLSLYSYRLEK